MTTAIEFLALHEVLEVHANQIQLYGGSEGIRDQGLLEAALAQPEATFGGEYLHKSIFEMAAAYFYHLVQNHPFIDGNKRVGTASAVVFLSINGYELNPDLDKPDSKTKRTKFEKVVLSVASGEIKKPEIARFFEESAVEF
jgi:death-on-curing protein